MAAVARAVTQGWVSWGAYNLGLLSFDHSVFGGTDVFGVSPLDISFTGPYDDVSSKISQIQVARGRSNNLDVVLAGTASVDIRDPTGTFNPDNTSSPLYGQLEDRLHPVKLIDTFAATTYGLFYGWVRRFHWEPQGRRGITRLECVDLFYWLERAHPVIGSSGSYTPALYGTGVYGGSTYGAAAGPTTTGAAIAAILDSIGIVDPAMRDLDAGDTIPSFSADGSKTALELIQGLLEAERGVFFIAGNGKATYRSRISRLSKVSAAMITDKMSDTAPGVDWDQSYTRITVKRSQNDYIAVAYDSTVVTKVGYNDMPEIDTPYLLSDAQADALAIWILSQNTSPKPPMRDFTIDNRESSLLTQLLARELIDKITVNAARGGTTGDFHIDSINLTIDGKTGAHTMQWLLSKAATVTPIIFDTSTFDTGNPIFVY